MATVSAGIRSARASCAAAVADGASPITDPGPWVSSHAARNANRVRVFPAPAGPTSTSTRRPETPIAVTARAWSGESRKAPGIGRAAAASIARGCAVGAVVSSCAPSSWASAARTSHVL